MDAALGWALSLLSALRAAFSFLQHRTDQVASCCSAPHGSGQDLGHITLDSWSSP